MQDLSVDKQGTDMRTQEHLDVIQQLHQVQFQQQIEMDQMIFEHHKQKEQFQQERDTLSNQILAQTQSLSEVTAKLDDSQRKIRDLENQLQLSKNLPVGKQIKYEAEIIEDFYKLKKLDVRTSENIMKS